MSICRCNKVFRRCNLILKRIPFLIKKFAVHVKVLGLISALKRTYCYLRHDNVFKNWTSTSLYSQDELEEQRMHVFDKQILFSIITPLYNTNPAYLKDMIDSVKKQTYSNWELCLVDGSDTEHGYVSDICLEYASEDDRIKYRKLDENYGIIGNSNECMKMACGNYIALLDHDDILHPAALHDVMNAICDKDADLIYTDELTFKNNDIHEVITIHFKPDYAPDNLRANNYICHFTAFKRSLLEEELLFRDGYEGSQDYDLVLRLSRRADCIVHIPNVLYYWRSCQGSTAESISNKPYCSESGRRAVADALREQGIVAVVENVSGFETIYRVKYELRRPLPLVSIIIPTRDKVKYLKACINSIRKNTTYCNYEIIVVDNMSIEQRTLSYLSEIERDGIKVIRVEGEFNWSLLNNRGVQGSNGDYYLFLNNDTEVVAPEWIEEMLMYAQRKDVGVVGAMLVYPDLEMIQHAGVVIGLGRIAGHVFKGVSRSFGGYMGRLSYAQNYSAVTGACQLVRKDIYNLVGGYDESIKVNYGDIDFCLKVRNEGYLIVWTPYAELIHHESKSRGLNDTEEKRELLDKESRVFIKKWRNQLEAGDPYFNPNLSLKSNEITLNGTQGCRNVKQNYDE